MNAGRLKARRNGGIKRKKNRPLELEFQCSCLFFPVARMSKETNLPFYQITTQLNGK